MSEERRRWAQQIIGGVLALPERYDDVFTRLHVSDFDGVNQAVAATLVALREQRVDLDVERVQAHLNEHFLGTGPDVTLAAFKAWEAYETFRPNLDWLVGEYERGLLRAEVWQVGQEIQRRVSVTSNEDTDEVLGWAIEHLTKNRDRLALPSDASTLTVEEFLDRTPAERDWVLPGLIAHGDKMVFTAGEGVGKSSMLRQLGVAAAWGFDPFTFRVRPQKRVLLVDLENHPADIRESLAPTWTEGRRHGIEFGHTSTAFNLYSRQAGLDLGNHSDVADLRRRVLDFMPDLLLFGPFYKAHRGDANEERLVVTVARVLDDLMTETGCAVLTEAHQPQAPAGSPRVGRPRGSAALMAWPGFGFGIHFDPARSDYELKPWRGARSLGRRWPRRIWRSDSENGAAPWWNEGEPE